MAAGSRERRNRAAAARAEAQAGEKRRERTVRIIGAVAVLAVVAGIIGVAVVARNADDNANAIDVIEADPNAPIPDGVLGADSEWHKPGGNRRARATRRAARPCILAPGRHPWARERCVGLPVSHAARNLHHRQLRRQRRTRIFQPAYNRRVVVEDLLTERRSAPCSRYAAGCGKQVLRAVWYAVQRALVLAVSNLAFGTPRLLHRPLARNRYHGIVARPYRFQPRQKGLRNLHRRNLPSPHQLTQLAYRHKHRVHSHNIPPLKIPSPIKGEG